MTRELVLTTGPAANGGSCVARHDGRVVFVRYALPAERVRVRVTAERGSYWHAEVVDVIEASADRIEPMCAIAGVEGAGCCDLAFVRPEAARRIKADIVANQLGRLGDFQWTGSAEPLGDGDPRGWRTRVKLGVDAQGRAGLHRYHSGELVTDLRCGQLPDGMTSGLGDQRWPGADQVRVVVDDDGVRHVVADPRRGGGPPVIQRVGGRVWRLPVTAFWQAHRDAPAIYTDVVGNWAADIGGARAWDLYGGAGLFAAVLADAVGERGRVLSVDTARVASAGARAALKDSPAVRVVTDSVRRFLAAQSRAADIAVLDPPRAGAGAEVVGALARAGVPRVIHVGCEAAAFARDVGLYLSHGYRVEELRVFDAFPLTHHLECIALLRR